MKNTVVKNTVLSNPWTLGVVALSLVGGTLATAQTTAPAAPTAPPATSRTPLTSPGAGHTIQVNPTQSDAPGATAQTAPQFPPVDPKNFTVASPTPQTVDSFLHAVWGLDQGREWRVAAIQPASVPGFVRVEVYVADKTQGGRIGAYNFLVTPDGKHAIAGELAPFGDKPFATLRDTLQQRADGPARGAVDKSLELVEFADLQCPSCKAAQGLMDQLGKDFPQAHIVYQNFPLTAVHPFAMQAAEVGNCVRQAKGDPAFFTYAQKVYDTQADLTTAKADVTLRAAVTATGADPAAVMACSTLPRALPWSPASSWPTSWASRARPRLWSTAVCCPLERRYPTPG